MRIDLSQLFPNGIQPKASSPVERGKSPAKANDGVQADLSGDSVVLGALHAKLQQVPEVREDRVAELRKSLANGTYRPDSMATAQAMMDEEGW